MRGRKTCRRVRVRVTLRSKAKGRITGSQGIGIEMVERVEDNVSG